ncbi:MAG: hypothetical protein ABR552_02645 [Actinomycetota bacterium]
MEEQKVITHQETFGSSLLWFGVLAGPLVWAGQLLLDFGLDEAVVCAPGARASGLFFNVGIESVIQITNAVATIITALAFVVSYRCYRRLRHSDRTEGARARWLAVAGMFDSGLFLLITVMKFASPFFLSPCKGTL